MDISSVEATFVSRYRRIFSVKEIEDTPVLQWALGALMLGIFVSFYTWINSAAISVSTALSGNAACWPYFQDCERLYFLEALPYYSQTTLYSFFFGVFLLVVYYMWRGDWTRVHMGILSLFLWKLFAMFVLSPGLAANYDYYDVVMGVVILLLPNKEAFAKVTFVLLYFLSATVKIHEGWIAASYFTTLVGGLPWISAALAPVATNIVIVEQIIGSWFLLSKKKLAQRLAFAFFVFFHLYSIVLVGYRYPSTALTMLVVLFGPMYRFTQVSFNRTTIVNWIFIVLLFVLQFLPIIAVPGDQRITLEANSYGFNMFEANHQCVSRVVYTLPGGETTTRVFESDKAWDRCNPYMSWLQIKNQCDAGTATAAAWTFDHSINGHPFYRIVDVENACTLTYQPLSHNAWIKTPEEGAAVIGRPLKNPYQESRF